MTHTRWYCGYMSVGRTLSCVSLLYPISQSIIQVFRIQGKIWSIETQYVLSLEEKKSI